LIEKLKQHFEKQEDAAEVSTSVLGYIDEILGYLPANLKIQLVKEMYRKTID
jgi:division protein CdvB (Snf7/Vps24/ESCRT-III family)